MHVLLTNDDGIHALGLRALYDALHDAGHSVDVVAPMTEQSAVGHSLTVFRALQAREVVEPHFKGVGVYGTPTDCVKLALSCLLPRRPDMVLSGINAGPNVGPDIMYSGTVAAATEGAHSGLPAVAVSCDDFHPSCLTDQAQHVVALLAQLPWQQLPQRCVVNINYPSCPIKESRGVCVCPQTTALWKDDYDERRDPRGRPYWWLKGIMNQGEIQEGTDRYMLTEKYITVTPLRFEFTDTVHIDVLKNTLG